MANRLGSVPLTVSLVLAALPLVGCDESQRLLDEAGMFDQEAQTYEPVPGKAASAFLEPVMGAAAADVDATLEAMAVAEGEKAQTNLRALGLTATEGPTTVSAGAADLLKAAQDAKEAFAASTFKQDPSTVFQKTSPFVELTASSEFSLLADTVNWTASGDRFTITTLNRMPVRDQGQRGTCAAHAGVGQLEGLILKKYSNIQSINLSEQRFYFLAKPEHWATGGDPNSQGSEAGSAYATSANYDWTTYDASWVRPSDVSKEGLNIPLEADCPYNPNPGDTDLQTPQAAGCANGVVRVKDYSAWIKDANRDLKTPQQIYDFLLAEDYPVVTATKLSDNWEDNDGIITLAEAGSPSDSVHAGGHAYLIVGAKKLDAAQFPNEGGMCFIIRNSWGTGWGVNGTSCMTLAWFNAWRFTNSAFGVAFDVEMDPAAVDAAVAAQDDLPDGAVEADPNSKHSDDDEPYGQLKQKRGKAHVDHLVEAAPALTADEFVVGQLLAGDGQTYKVLYKAAGEEVLIRGVLKGQTKLTHDLKFMLKDNRRIVKYVPGKGDIAFGDLDQEAKRVTLCGGTFASACDLNYVEEWNELVAGLTEAEAKREDSEGPFNWQTLELAGYAVELSVPESTLGKVDMRFKIAEVITNPQRFAVDPVGGAIQWHGREIGNYQSLSVCSGDFAAVCRIVVAGDQFNVLSKAKPQ